jgi:hypothetical protein
VAEFVRGRSSGPSGYVWSTWFFYFVGVMAIVLAIDAYKT